MSHIEIDLKSAGAARAYDLMSNLIVPRPIAFVSTISASGHANLAPFSYFMIGGPNPPSLAFCPTLGGGGTPKDTLRNLEETGEFVVNLVTRSMADGMNQTSAPYPHEFDEWEVSGFTQAASSHVRPARVAESPLSCECRVFQIVSHGEGAGASRHVIGEILAMHVDENLLRGDEIGRIEPIARLGGPDYIDLADGSRFALQRPKA